MGVTALSVSVPASTSSCVAISIIPRADSLALATVPVPVPCPAAGGRGFQLRWRDISCRVGACRSLRVGGTLDNTLDRGRCVRHGASATACPVIPPAGDHAPVHVICLCGIGFVRIRGSIRQNANKPRSVERNGHPR